MADERDRLAEIQTGLSKMSNEELLEFIRTVRQERKIPQHHVKAKAKRKVKAKDDLAALIKGISPDKLKALLEKVNE